MKILFAAPVSFYQYTFFISQYVMGLAKASKRLGHDIRVIQTTENRYNPYLWKFIEKEFQIVRQVFRSVVDIPHDLLLMIQVCREIKKYKPDVLFLHLVDTSYFSYIVKRIKNQGCKVLVWLGVHPSRVSKGIHDLLRQADCTLIYDTTYLDYFQSLGIRNTKVIPLGCDVSYYASVNPDPEAKEKFRVDVSFVGLFDRFREKYLKALSEFNLGIWSWNLKDYNTPLKKFHRGTAFGKSMIEVFKSSKIVINIHREHEMNGGNYRLFEIPACKAFQLVDNKKEIGKYFEIGKEIVTFDDENDLKAKVEYYIAHESEREEIARAGYERIRRDHSLVNRMKKIIADLDGN